MKHAIRSCFVTISYIYHRHCIAHLPPIVIAFSCPDSYSFFHLHLTSLFPIPNIVISLFLNSSENFRPVNVYKIREAPLSDAAYEQLNSSFSYARLPTMWEITTYSGWPKPKTEEIIIEKPKSEVENILGDLLGTGSKTKGKPKRDKMTIKGTVSGGNPSKRELHISASNNDKTKTSPQRQRDQMKKK